MIKKKKIICLVSASVNPRIILTSPPANAKYKNEKVNSRLPADTDKSYSVISD